MNLDFSMEVKEDEKTPVITVKGELDVYTCPRLNNVLKELVEEQEKNNVVLNLEDIQYIDSTGLGTIAHTARKVSESNGKIHVVCTKPQVRKIFEVSGLVTKNIKLFEEEKEAILDLA